MRKPEESSVIRRQGESFAAFQARQRADSAERAATRRRDIVAERSRCRTRATRETFEGSDFDYSMNE